jgi:ATP/maltotriose-dependent transcriptional regulator MalT
VLPAHVEIMLAAGDVTEARATADELSQMAAGAKAPFLDAIAFQARGAVSLAEGEPGAALTDLRAACALWEEFEAPYEVARVRLLIGLACRQLRDEDTAEMEFGAARWTLERLGAAPDLARLDALARQPTPTAAEGLTGREVEVLALVATGKTNREIATDLFISEKTVARHVANIFVKLAVTTRAAATAYAYKHDLV